MGNGTVIPTVRIGDGVNAMVRSSFTSRLRGPVNGKTLEIATGVSAGFVVLLLMALCICCFVRKRRTRKARSSIRSYNEYSLLNPKGSLIDDKRFSDSKTPVTDARREELSRKYNLPSRGN
ncbi:hypothetical protein PROFUN_11778 [Planoprotostelium fungivorum]|uniref:Uncharacterized protein n=1 Tax=Planoprotostelium fungivorum TaxID=1890364 RepID=A0A2P6N8M7_9EUKA|nr:hypothetical protein PROFUN_11778 [Planoprotostelium fungivorum]